MYKCTKCRVCADFLFVFAVRMLNPCVQCMPSDRRSLIHLNELATSRHKTSKRWVRSVLEWNVSEISSPSSPPSEPSEPLCHWNWSPRSHCKEQNWKDYVQMSVFRYLTCDMSWDVTEHGRIEMDLSMTCYGDLRVWRVTCDDSPGAISFSLPSGAAGQHFVQLKHVETGVVGVHHAAVSPCLPRSPHFAVCRMDYVSPWIFGEADETELWFATGLRRKVKKLW